MILKSIRAQKYKSLNDTGIIEFNFPNQVDDSSGLTVLVGENNSGKSAFLGLPYLLRSDYQINDEDKYEAKDIQIDFVFDEDRTATIKNIDGGARLSNVGNVPNNSSFEVLKSNRLWQSNVAAGHNDDMYHRRKNFKRLELDSSFGSVLSFIQDDATRKDEFDKIIKKLIPNFKSWTTGRFRGNSYIKYVIDDRSEVSIDDAFGDGILNLFKIVYSITTNRIIFIDEPEAFLHPRAQIELSNILSEASKLKQIVISTHSPYILKSLNYKFAKILHFKLEDKETKIKEIKFSKTDYIPFAKVSYDVYGTNAEEYFESLYLEKYSSSGVKNHTAFSRHLATTLGIPEDRPNTALGVTSGSMVCKPVFIRNSIHYPDIRDPNFNEELVESISLLE